MRCNVMWCHVMRRNMMLSILYFAFYSATYFLLRLTLILTRRWKVLLCHSRSISFTVLSKNRYSANRLFRKKGCDKSCTARWEVSACDLLSDALRTGGEWMTRLRILLLLQQIIMNLRVVFTLFPSIHLVFFSFPVWFVYLSLAVTCLTSHSPLTFYGVTALEAQQTAAFVATI